MVSCSAPSLTSSCHVKLNLNDRSRSLELLYSSIRFSEPTCVKRGTRRSSRPTVQRHAFVPCPRCDGTDTPSTPLTDYGKHLFPLMPWQIFSLFCTINFNINVPHGWASDISKMTRCWMVWRPG